MQLETPVTCQTRRLLLGAKIIFNNRNSVFDCTVRALSAEGAEIRMKNTLGVPEMFQLVVQPHGDKFECQLAWRTETDIGVTFELTQASTASPLMKNLRLGE